MEDLHIEVVKEIISKNHKETNGSCGIYIAAIQQQSKIPMNKLNPILRKLYEEKYFNLREGLNGKLIFKRNSIKKPLK